MAKRGLAAPSMLPAPPMLSQRTPLRMERLQVPSKAAWRAPPGLHRRGVSKADSVSTLLGAAPGLAAGTLASAVTLAASVRRAQKQLSTGRHKKRGSTRRAAQEGDKPPILAEVQPQRFEAAKKNAKKFNFKKLESYPVKDLETVYIDSKWTYYESDKKIIEDRDFDKLKEVLKKLGSEFASLNREEIALIEASIAYYQGTPIMKDEEYDRLKKVIMMSGRRKDVTAMALRLRGEEYLSDEQYETMTQAFTLTTYINFAKLDKYTLAELEELYIDALWSYYREKRPLIPDKDYDKLKKALYARESRFPTLTQTEVAFVEASIAYYRGEPLLSDQEYDKLKAEVYKKGARKEVIAFLLYQRGERFLSSEQFESMKDEYEKLGIQAVDLEQCSQAQMEEMYVDALWAYYKDGTLLLNDEQYDKLRMELQCQGSGFPTLTQSEVEFVKATLSYYRGEPVATDEEWKELKDKVLREDGQRKDVTAFLLYSKGQESLDPDTFEEMKEEMARLGLTVQKAGTKALEQTLSITSDKLENDLGQVALMVTALAALPTILCTVVVWSIGLALDLGFVPEAEWASVLTAEFIPLFAIGLVGGLLVTSRLFVFLDLQNPEILTGTCPSCNADIKQFSGGEKQDREVKFSCKECGCKMVLNTATRKIGSAGLGAKIEGDGDEPTSFDWSKAWQTVKKDTKKEVPVDA